MNSPLQAAARRASLQRELNRMNSLQARIQRASVTFAMWLFIVGVTTAACYGCAINADTWCEGEPASYGTDC